MHGRHTEGVVAGATTLSPTAATSGSVSFIIKFAVFFEEERDAWQMNHGILREKAECAR